MAALVDFRTLVPHTGERKQKPPRALEQREDSRELAMKMTKAREVEWGWGRHSETGAAGRPAASGGANLREGVLAESRRC